jgi:DNA primase
LTDDAAELSEALDLEFVLEREGIRFKRTMGSSGLQLNCVECPHCGDRRSRVYLNAETGVGNCFVCNEKFSKLGFINQMLGGSWRDTFKYVKEALKEQGWRPRKRIEVAVEKEKAVMPPSFELPTPEGQNLLYLEERGVNDEWTRYFHLRFCEEGWWNFKREDGSRGGQRFDNRLLIPVYDLDGTFQTFQGRDLTGKSEKKYLFPSGLPGTGRFLLNGQNAQRRSAVVIGEGFFDVAAIKIAFDEDPALRNVEPVGSFGKHLSYGALDGNDQLGRFLLLKRQGLKQVTIMWDGEEKALIAAIEAGERLQRIGLAVKIALLPADKDPNEVPAEVVREVYWKATPLTPAQAIKWRLRNPYIHR